MAALTLVLPAAASAAPVILHADADTTIRGLTYNIVDGEPGPITDNSNSNYGSGTTFAARFSPGSGNQHRYEKGYVRFAEDGVVFASTADAALEFYYQRDRVATFELFGLKDASLVPGGYGVGRLGEDWPETGTGSITWNNAPGNDGVPTSGTDANAFDGNAVFLYEFTTPAELGYIVTNDTPAKTAALLEFLQSDTGGLVTFMVRAKNPATLQGRFYTKEYSDGSFAPRLEVLPAVSANYSGTGHIDIFGDPGWDSTRLPNLAADIGTIGDGAACLVPRASKEWAGQLHVATGGILRLDEADTTYNLTSRLQGGTLEVASGGTGYFRYTGTLTLDDVPGNEIRVGNSSAQSLDFRSASTITGPGGFTKTGPGTLTLSGVNTYTGTTHLEEGALEVASLAALGPNDVALSGGVLRHTASGEVANRIVLDITDGLAASWQFDGDALDSSGNNHHGTINGATWTDDRFGRPSQALSFDGLANNVTTTLADTFTDEFTISAWVQRTEGLSRRHARLLGFRSFGKGIDLDASGQIFVEVYVDGTRTNTTRTPLGDVLPQDEWVHLTMVVSRPESYMRFYADDALVAGRSLPAGTFNTFTNFLIGHNAPGTASDFVRHQIDDVRVYDRALSLDEIGQIGGALVAGIDIAEGAEVTYAGSIVGAGGFEKRGRGTLILAGRNTYTGPTTVAAGTLDVAHANALGPGDLAIGNGVLRHTASAEMGNRMVLDITDGLAASWQFDGDALDSSGNNRHGTIVGATWTEDRFGQPNKALAFDGQNDYVTTTLPDVFTDEFTISAWVQRTDGASSVHQRFLGFRHFGKGVDVDASGRIFVEVNIPSASDNGRFGATRTPQESLLPLGEWVHLAMVVSRPDNWMGFYADGDLLASRSLPEGDLGTFVDFVIGKHPTYGTMGMQSSVDDVRVYHRALSAGEVGKLTNSFLAPIEVTEGVEVTYKGSLVGTGGMEKLGQGTLVLAGRNTYTGPTTVAAGTLMVDGTTHANSAVTVNAGATLGGTGTIGGATIIREDATLSPGVSIGTLTFENALILENGAIWDWEFLSNSPGEYDQVLGTNNGRLILPNDGTGTIALNIQGHDDHRLSAGDSFTLFAGDVYLGSTLLDPGQDISDLFRITISENIDWWGTWEVTGGSLILTAVPEPGSLLLLLSALACGLLVRWRR